MTNPYIQLDLPATYRFLNILGACIGELLAREEGLVEADIVAYNVQLAAQEICVNIVEHAYAGDDGRIGVRLIIEGQPRELVLELHDHGKSFDPSGVCDPDLEAIQERGYGLFLAQTLMDKVMYEVRADGNHWTLVKVLE